MVRNVHHAIRRVQEDQSMSMMLDPNKHTKDTGRSTSTRSTGKTSTSKDDEGCDFSDFTGDWAPADDICKTSFEPQVVGRPEQVELEITKVCNKNYAIFDCRRRWYNPRDV